MKNVRINVFVASILVIDIQKILEIFGTISMYAYSCNMKNMFDINKYKCYYS